MTPTTTDATFGDVSVVLDDRPRGRGGDAPAAGQLLRRRPAGLGGRGRRLGRRPRRHGPSCCARRAATSAPGSTSGRPDSRSPTHSPPSTARRRAWSTGRCPLVAAVQGSAVGGGLGLALAADFRVAAPTSRFTANFARLGFHQGFGISLTLPAVVGRQAALELLTTGAPHRRRPRRWPSACATGSTTTRGRAPTPWPTRSPDRHPWPCGRSDAPCGPTWSTGSRAMVDHERTEQLRLMGTADFREGIAASLARREPDFTGE